MVVTFIISSDFKENFKKLCNKRLGKQRLEALRIIEKLEYFDENGWDPSDYKGTNNTRYVTQPVLLMWKGYTDALKLYFNMCVEEWRSRGFKNTMPLFEVGSEGLNKKMAIKDINKKTIKTKSIESGESKKSIDTEKKSQTDIKMPPWLDWKPLHYSHQAALMRKAPDDYEGKFPDLPKKYIKYGYVWPTKIDKKYFSMDIKKIKLSKICGELPNHRYCKALFKSGDRKGKECHAKIKDSGYNTCRRHRAQEDDVKE